MQTDFILDKNNELEILNGDFSIGESELQEVAIIFQLRQGELKSDPVLGANLQHFMKGKYDRIAIERRTKIHLERDNKRYEDIMKKVKFNIE